MEMEYKGKFQLKKFQNKSKNINHVKISKNKFPIKNDEHEMTNVSFFLFLFWWTEIKYLDTQID